VASWALDGKTVESAGLRNATGHPHTNLLYDKRAGRLYAGLACTLNFDKKPSERYSNLATEAGLPENLRHLRDMDFPGMTVRGLELVDGKQLLRYEVPHRIWYVDASATTIWADPKTKRPVRVRESRPAQGPIPGDSWEWYPLTFDEPMDDSLFQWPSLAGCSVVETVRVYGPRQLWGTRPRIRVEAPDGKRLLTEGDLDEYGGMELRLSKPEQFMKLTAPYAGQRLRVTVGNAPPQELEVWGPIKEFYVELP
jgi:hypothetical protein